MNTEINYSSLNLSLPISDTPPELADWMVKLAEIKSEHIILEPSAGKGNIVDAIIRAWHFHNIFICELNSCRLDNLLNNFPVTLDKCDFNSVNNYYDRIIMNPPLKHTIKHIQKAYSLLKPGGKLVALIHGIVMEDETFKNWHLSQNGRSYQVNNKFFTGQSGVNSLVLVIDKQ